MHLTRTGLFALLLLSGCDKPSLPPPPPRPALVMHVTTSAPAPVMTLVGEIQPRYLSAQGFRINGKITQRLVEVGAQVKKGQTIAQLDAIDSSLTTHAALAEVSAADATFALAKAELTRQQQLYNKKFISASALDNKVAELKAASAQLAKVKAQAKVTGNQSNYTDLSADRDGVVTMIHAEPGQVVNAGDPIVQIAATDAVDVLVAVPESRLHDVTVNAPVSIRLWSDRQTLYSGVVREIAPAADSATRNFTVRVTLLQPDTAVKFGMTAGVSFHAENSTTAALLIPTSALTEIKGQPSVWIIDADNKAQPRAVNAGPFSEAGIAISSGLHAGDTIAIAGVHTLFPGQLVRPVFEATP